MVVYRTFEELLPQHSITCRLIPTIAIDKVVTIHLGWEAVLPNNIWVYTAVLIWWIESKAVNSRLAVYRADVSSSHQLYG